MALVRCIECGKEISTQAEACPNCGRKWPKRTSVATWIVVAFLGFGVLMGIFANISNSSKRDEQQATQAKAEEAYAARLAAMTPAQRAAEIKHDADMAAQIAMVTKANAEADGARYACKDFVKRSLNDPDAAQFDDASDYYIERQSGGRFLVQVKMRAKNGFNALRHIAVNCVTRRSGENWVAISVKQIT